MTSVLGLLRFGRELQRCRRLPRQLESRTPWAAVWPRQAGRSAAGVEAVLASECGRDQPEHASLLGFLLLGGNCSAVGSYLDNSGATQGLLLTETAGMWATGVEAVLPASAATSKQDVSLYSVSCSSAGNCSAVGSYLDNSGATQGLLLTETAGTWATGVEAVLPANAATSKQDVSLYPVSCSSAGNCSAVGSYTDSSGATQGLLLTETAGTWGVGVEAALPANAVAAPHGVELTSVSCASAGNCSAVGMYNNDSSTNDGVLLTETGGLWAPGVEAILPDECRRGGQGPTVRRPTGRRLVPRPRELRRRGVVHRQPGRIPRTPAERAGRSVVERYRGCATCQRQQVTEPGGNAGLGFVRFGRGLRRRRLLQRLLEQARLGHFAGPDRDRDGGHLGSRCGGGTASERHLRCGAQFGLMSLRGQLLRRRGRVWGVHGRAGPADGQLRHTTLSRAQGEGRNPQRRQALHQGPCPLLRRQGEACPLANESRRGT